MKWVFVPSSMGSIPASGKCNRDPMIGFWVALVQMLPKREQDYSECPRTIIMNEGRSWNENSKLSIRMRAKSSKMGGVLGRHLRIG